MSFRAGRPMDGGELRGLGWTKMATTLLSLPGLSRQSRAAQFATRVTEVEMGMSLDHRDKPGDDKSAGKRPTGVRHNPRIVELAHSPLAVWLASQWWATRWAAP